MTARGVPPTPPPPGLLLVPLPVHFSCHFRFTSRATSGFNPSHPEPPIPDLLSRTSNPRPPFPDLQSQTSYPGPPIPDLGDPHPIPDLSSWTKGTPNRLGTGQVPPTRLGTRQVPPPPTRLGTRQVPLLTDKLKT